MRSWSRTRKRRLESAARIRREELRQLKRDVRKDLVVEEYKTVRDSVKMNIDIMEKTEVYAAGAFAAVATFALSAKSESIALGSAAVAVTVAAVGALRYRALARTISIHDRFIETILEKKYSDLSWESFYRIERDKVPKWSLFRLRTARWTLWWVLLAASFALMYSVWKWGPFGPDEMVVRRYPI